MRKNYTMTLEIEATERVKEWLRGRGLSLSGWVNALIIEVDRELQGDGNSWMRKSVSEMTLQEFSDGLQRWISKIKEEEE